MHFVNISNFYYLSILVIFLQVKNCVCQYDTMPKEEIIELREEARDMFYHAYRAYMENAYPADELMPLSCQGRFRGRQPSRGDIDDAMGNFSLTLIDSLDTLVILGDLEEFEHAVKLVIKDVSFDSDIVVSVFETNIRVLGGLLSAHILAEQLRDTADVMHWYRGELLNMAKDLGYRLLPAFNTSTGIPYARVNLRHGIRHLQSQRETCTACAGTTLLEFATLSRLTGIPHFEHAAHTTMSALWRRRHHATGLIGSVLHVQTGDWIRRHAGLGAGSDSYYEYLLKAYILLALDGYWARYKVHYGALRHYVRRGPLHLLDVHMHRPHAHARTYMDALAAFWPGLQVLTGDLKPAIETHEMLYQLMQRHTLIPEAFTADFDIHWAQHPLRPEFLESTYYLYKATRDHHYLYVAKEVLKNLQRLTRVSCGYAAVRDIRTFEKEDRLDSFVLAETFKYLYLIFTEPEDLPIDIDSYILTTEAHLLPLSIANLRSNSSDLFNNFDEEILTGDIDDADAKVCKKVFLSPRSVREALKEAVHETCVKRDEDSSGEAGKRIRASEFQINNLEHLKSIKDMGVSVVALADGRFRLIHTFSSARSQHDAEAGLQFMQEMHDISKVVRNDAPIPHVTFTLEADKSISFHAAPAHFGKILKSPEKVTAPGVKISPFRGCSPLENGDELKGKIAIIERGDCMFIEKARTVQKHGAIGAIVVDNMLLYGISVNLFQMRSDGKDDVTIPVVFLLKSHGDFLIEHLKPDTLITLSEFEITEDLTTGKKSQNTESSKDDLITPTNEIKSLRDLETRILKIWELQNALDVENPNKPEEDDDVSENTDKNKDEL